MLKGYETEQIEEIHRTVQVTEINKILVFIIIKNQYNGCVLKRKLLGNVCCNIWFIIKISLPSTQEWVYLFTGACFEV